MFAPEILHTSGHAAGFYLRRAIAGHSGPRISLHCLTATNGPDARQAATMRLDFETPAPPRTTRMPEAINVSDWAFCPAGKALPATAAATGLPIRRPNSAAPTGRCTSRQNPRTAVPTLAKGLEQEFPELVVLA